MSIELVSIGDELLCGATVNTNASWLGQRLREEGWSVSRQTTLADNRSEICQGLKEALSRSSIVLCTGGLGPTVDDITLECAVTLFSSASVEIPNHIGSAPGLMLEERLILMPGVPQEMKNMFEKSILPWLHKKMPPQKAYRAVLHFCLLRENDVDPLLRELTPTGVQFGIYPSYGTVTVRLSSQDEKALFVAKERLETEFKKHQFFSPSGTIEEAVHLWFTKNRKTLALAESCTGGMMAAHLTALPGASDYFLGSIVAYSNVMKRDMLGVLPSTLEKHGAVSDKTVQEMWQGVLHKTQADWGMAVSGIAGPDGGTKEKPVGTVWYAYGAQGEKPCIGRFDLGTRNRETIILISTKRLFGLLWQALS